MWRIAQSHEQRRRVEEPAPLPCGHAALVIGVLSALCWAVLLGLGWAVRSLFL